MSQIYPAFLFPLAAGLDSNRRTSGISIATLVGLIIAIISLWATTRGTKLLQKSLKESNKAMLLEKYAMMQAYLSMPSILGQVNRILADVRAAFFVRKEQTDTERQEWRVILHSLADKLDQESHTAMIAQVNTLKDYETQW